MQIFCVANQKGGCGKSTTADALSAYLSKRGNVLSVDLDAQCNLTAAYGLDPYAGGASVLEYLSGQCSLSEAVRKARNDIVPCSPYLTASLGDARFTGALTRLRKALHALKSRYDFAVIDTPPGISLLSLSAMASADVVIVPASADLFSIRAIEELLKTVEAVKKEAGHAVSVGGILLTRHTPRSNLSKFAAEQIASLARAKGVPLLTSFIRECVAVKEAQAFGRDIFDYAPNSNAAADYAAAFDEIFKRAKEE